MLIFVWFGARVRAWWGLSPSPPPGIGPQSGMILLMDACFVARVLGWLGFSPSPPVVECPFGSRSCSFLLVLGLVFGAGGGFRPRPPVVEGPGGADLADLVLGSCPWGPFWG